MELGFSPTGDRPGKQDQEPALLPLATLKWSVPCVLTDRSVSRPTGMASRYAGSVFEES